MCKRGVTEPFSGVMLCATENHFSNFGFLNIRVQFDLHVLFLEQELIVRAGDIFKFAHMSVFVASISLGVFGLSIVAGTAVQAQGIDEPDEPLGDPPADPPVTPPEEPREPPEEPGEEQQPDPEDIVDNPRDIGQPRESIFPLKDRIVIKSDRDAFDIPNSIAPNPRTTTAISDAIINSEGFCNGLMDERYKPDCIAERLLAVARAMPRTGEYAEAREILTDAAQEIRALVRANVAPDAPPVSRAVGKLGDVNVRTRPLLPVKRESLRQVNQRAANILQEAETKLLRAAEASDRRLIAYAQIAQAVGSNKRLLRSA